MSGPVTLEFLLIQGALLGAKAILDSAADVHAGWQELREAAAASDAKRRLQAQHEREQMLRATRSIADRTAALEASLARLCALAETLQPALAAAGITLDLPRVPAAMSDPQARIQALEEAVAALRDALASAGQRLAPDGESAIDAATLERLSAPRSIDDLLEAYARASADERARHAAENRRGVIEAVLAPLEGGTQSLTPELEHVLRELAGPASQGRAEALLVELRRLVAAERKRQEGLEQERAKAEALLASFDEFDLTTFDAGPLLNELQAIRQQLTLVAAGAMALSEPMESRARALAAALTNVRERAVQEAAARVLEGTLKDLGFVVEPIANTLFIDGGVAHFTRPEWGDYAVRLRSSATQGTLNFNVVREHGTEAADALSTHLRDTAAEEKWCAHIPKLRATLAARGIQLNVRRMLEAGEAPTQAVPAGTLKALHGDKQTAVPARPIERSLP